jgi:hypothetical protein
MNLTKREDVAALKSNFHAVFDTPQGQEVMKFLEATCCWRQSVWHPGQPDMTLINDGKRQVISTIKTFLELSPDQITGIINQKEE